MRRRIYQRKTFDEWQVFAWIDAKYKQVASGLTKAAAHDVRKQFERLTGKQGYVQFNGRIPVRKMTTS